MLSSRARARVSKSRGEIVTAALICREWSGGATRRLGSREAETAGRDDPSIDLARSCGDGESRSVQVERLDAPAELGVRRSGRELTIQSQEVHADGAEPLREFGAVEFRDRRLVVGDLPFAL